MDRETAYVVLNLLPGIGPARVRTLLDRFGSAPAILSTSLSNLSETIGSKLGGAIYKWREEVDLDAELGKIEGAGVKLITWECASYPQLLLQTSGPPILLYVRGELTARDDHALAIVGTRQISHYGRECTQQFGFQLAHAGYTIVSGLARGVDTAAHEAALAANGRTIAVLGSGLAKLSPPENAPLADRIAQNGAVISQFPMDYNADRQSFPIRNRVVSGMCYGVLVIEGTQNSGSMITANQANEQGRLVFAVPGQIDRPNAAGPNRLIQDGAKLVTRAADILEELGDSFLPAPEPTRPAVQLEGNERLVYDALSDEPSSIEVLVTKTGLSSAQVSATLMKLEMSRFARQLPGSLFEKLYS